MIERSYTSIQKWTIFYSGCLFGINWKQIKGGKLKSLNLRMVKITYRVESLYNYENLWNNNILNFLKSSDSNQGISENELIWRITNSGSWALEGNADIDGAIIRTPVTLKEGEKPVCQTFLRSGGRFVDLGIDAAWPSQKTDFCANSVQIKKQFENQCFKTLIVSGSWRARTADALNQRVGAQKSPPSLKLWRAKWELTGSNRRPSRLRRDALNQRVSA